jgi:hypothetical protein
VHEDHAVVFETRWVMSYLAGPMTREQIRALAAERQQEPGAEPAGGPADRSPAPAPAAAAAAGRPLLPPGISQWHLAARTGDVVYYPRVYANAEVAFSSARYGVDERREYRYTVEVDDTGAIDWGQAEPLAGEQRLTDSGAGGAGYADCAAAAADEKNYEKWRRGLARWLRQNESVKLLTSKRFKLTSEATESEGVFRARLQQTANETRDRAVAALRKRYSGQATTLENRLLRAEQAVAREAEQSSQSKLDTAVSFGTAVLGALLGRKRLSTTTATRVGSAIRRAGGARKQAADVARARETAAKVRADIEQLEAKIAAEIEALDVQYDAQQEALEEVLVRPKTTDVHVSRIGLLWMPWRERGDGRVEPAWQP